MYTVVMCVLIYESTNDKMGGGIWHAWGKEKCVWGKEKCVQSYDRKS